MPPSAVGATGTRCMPLLCNICPKRPDFSDVSHLLTHVASKGHLSNYYRMKVKGSQDPIAGKAVADYDAWYTEWNVDDLMRERMSQKEKKRTGTGQINRRLSRVSATIGSSRSTPATTYEKRVHERPQAGPLDPQLDHRIKIEPLSRSNTPTSLLGFDPTFAQRTYIPPIQPPCVTPYEFAEPILKQESVSSSFSEEELSETALFGNQYVLQNEPHHRPRVSLHSIPSAPDDEGQPSVTITESSKLKGVYWPGMAMFDAALPEARRKRNQKKEISVLHQLQATSETVEPFENVFDKGGTLRKQRTITGHPESDDTLIEGESSPLAETTEKKRTRKSRARSALTEKHPNNGRNVRQRRDVDGDAARLNHARRRHVIHNGPGVGEEDDDLTYLSTRPNPKRSGLSIHRDNSGPEITFDHPAPFNLLTASFREPLRSASYNDTIQTQPRFSNPHSTRFDHRHVAWGFSEPFRPVVHNGMASHSFPSFGHYISQSMGNLAHQANANSQQGFSAFGHHPTLISGPLSSNEHTNLPSHQVKGSPWNMFAFEHQDLGIPDVLDNPFPSNTDAASGSGLFDDKHQEEALDDDQATVSASSER